MIKVSTLFRNAMAASWTPATRVDILRGSTVVSSNVPVVGGSYEADTTTTTRLKTSLELANTPEFPVVVDSRQYRVRVYSGITSLGFSEWIQLGEFRVDEVNSEDTGRVKIQASGLEAYVIDDRFIKPRTPPYRASTLGEIRQLILESAPWATVVYATTKDQRIMATAPWDKERWDAIEALGKSLNIETFVDHTGRFIIADVPPVIGGVPVMTIDEGPGGVLLTRNTVDTRDQVYNAVSVSGQSTDPNVPPVWGWAYDNNPASDTWYYGNFGKVTKFYSSSFFTSNAQCITTAEKMLPLAAVHNNQLFFLTAPIPFLEVGDIIAVRALSGDMEVHQLTRLSWNYGGGSDNRLSAETVSYKVVLPDSATDGVAPHA